MLISPTSREEAVALLRHAAQDMSPDAFAKALNGEGAGAKLRDDLVEKGYQLALQTEQDLDHDGVPEYQLYQLANSERDVIPVLDVNVEEATELMETPAFGQGLYGDFLSALDELYRRQADLPKAETELDQDMAETSVMLQGMAISIAAHELPQDHELAYTAHAVALAVSTQDVAVHETSHIAVLD